MLGGAPGRWDRLLGFFMSSSTIAALFDTKTAGNFIAEILRVAYRKVIAAGNAETGFAWKELRAGIYRAAGPTGLGAAYFYREEIITFVVDNASNLKVFVQQAFHNPDLLRIIELIVQSTVKAI
jgi:hypothetical protein